MPTYPLTPVPTPIYPAGIQAAVTVVNVGDTAMSVSPISAPFSGFSIAKGGSIEWPAMTPLWVYGEVGGLVAVGGVTNLTATPNVTPNVTVTPNITVNVPTTTNPGGSTGTDEDTLRVYNNSQIAALTAADKSTNFTIWNTDTNAMQYCVNGNIIAPNYGGTIKTQGTYTGDTSSGRAIPTGNAPDLVLVSSSLGAYGWLHRTETSTSQSQYQTGTQTAEYITPTGFVVGQPGASSPGRALNVGGATYYWTAYQFQSSTVTQVASSPAAAFGDSTILAGKSIPTTYSGTPFTFNVGSGFDQVQLEFTCLAFANNGSMLWASGNPLQAMGLQRSNTGVATIFAPSASLPESQSTIQLFDTANTELGLTIKNLTYTKATGVVSFEVRSNNSNTSHASTIIRWRAY